MKTPARILIASLTLACASAFAQAQSLKVLFIDVSKVYDQHYKKDEQMGKVQAEQQKATEELDRLNQEGNALVAQFKEYEEQMSNPASNDDAKAKARDAANQKYQEIQKKQREVQEFSMNTQKMLQSRVNNIKGLLLDEIGKVATELAKSKGATMLLEKSGPSIFGVPTVLYSDDSLDITDEVIAEVNKNRPAATPAATPAAPAAPAASTPAPAAEKPLLNFPSQN